MLSIASELAWPGIKPCFSSCLGLQKHDQCSEGFYRDQVQTDIKTAPSATAEERLKMMALLKRFEESNVEEAGLDDEDEEEDAMIQRLKGVDLGTTRLELHPRPDFRLMSLCLDSVSPDDLWSLLPEEQRDKFIRTIEDPSSELAKQLLADDGLVRGQFTPWWRDIEDPSVKRPTVMSLPRAMVERMPGDGPSLLYNICAVW